MMIQLVFNTTPPSLNSAYKKYRNRIVLSNRAKEFKQIIADTSWDPFDKLRGPVKLDVTFQFKGKRKRDLDNYLKVLIDSLKGIYFEDDDQVYEVVARKEIDCQQDRTEIRISHFIVPQ